MSVPVYKILSSDHKILGDFMATQLPADLATRFGPNERRQESLEDVNRHKNAITQQRGSLPEYKILAFALKIDDVEDFSLYLDSLSKSEFETLIVRISNTLKESPRGRV